MDEPDTPRRAAEFLDRARMKERKSMPRPAEMPDVQIENRKAILGKTMKPIGRGHACGPGVFVTGAAAAAGLYTAAGIFGTASTEAHRL